MNSRQITFYFTPEDVLQIDSYLKKNELLILGQPMPDSKPIILPSLLLNESDSKKYKGHKYIIRSQDIDSIIIKYISEQNYYLVDGMNSPVIETGYSNFKNNGLIKKSDRIYYIKDALLKEPLRRVPKSPEFLQMADDFFKWFRKEFHNAKLPGFEHDIVSLACADWVSSGGQLVKN